MERIPTKRLVYEFDRKFDRFRSELKKNLRLVDKLNILNEAQMILFEKKAKLAEVNDEVRNSLAPFEEKEVKLKIIEKKPNFVVAELPKNFYKRLRQKAVCSKDCDTPKKTIPIVIFKSDKLEAALKNPFWKPSYEWEMVLGDEGSKGLYIWHSNEFDIDEVYIDYLRKPDELQEPSLSEKGEYEDWNGVIRKKVVNCEFSTNFDHRKIVDIGILLARADMGDNRDFQTSLAAIMNTENYRF